MPFGNILSRKSDWSAERSVHEQLGSVGSSIPGSIHIYSAEINLDHKLIDVKNGQVFQVWLILQKKCFLNNIPRDSTSQHIIFQFFTSPSGGFPNDIRPVNVKLKKVTEHKN